MFLKPKIISVLLIIIASIFIGIWAVLDDGVDQMPFESSAWKNNPTVFSLESVRLRMVDDFLDTHNIIGMSREEVVLLLGEPDQTEYFKSYEMVYMLGQETDSYFAIDSQWLAIHVDGTAVVESIDILTD
ncbi:MAG: hypothetical protein HOC27_03775 [Phycisphaerae bacterium]|nr:hypothetical protein [Phycisphaerae bacterium]